MNTHTVGQGFSLGDAQGRVLEHDSFHPPHNEYEGDPHPAQNYETLVRRLRLTQGKEDTHLVSVIPIDHTPS